MNFKLFQEKAKAAYCLIFILIPLILSGQAKGLNFYSISNKDGLSNNFVTCILEDKLGFIWIGTSEGLNRWDGYNFKFCKSNPEDLNSLPGNFILSF